MKRRVVAVLAGTFLMLVAATLWVPTTPAYRWYGSPPPTRSLNDVEYRWIFGGQRYPLRSVIIDGPSNMESAVWLEYHDAVHWPLVIAEHSFILVLGGGLLTWVARRDRRRRAELAA